MNAKCLRFVKSIPRFPSGTRAHSEQSLAKDKSLRYQTAAALHRDLNRFLNTQYPEFSPHDFSVFMKNAFSAAFLDQRRKLVEFAKIQNTGTEDKTVITRASEHPAPALRTTLAPAPFEDADEKLNIDTSTDIRVSLDHLKPPPRPLTGVSQQTNSGITHTRTQVTGIFNTSSPTPNTMTRTPAGGVFAKNSSYHGPRSSVFFHRGRYRSSNESGDWPCRHRRSLVGHEQFLGQKKSRTKCRNFGD